MPLVSVIVPVYGVEKYVSKTIESVLTQTLCDFELIIVDDCSIDASLNICEHYARIDNRIKIIRQERNVGPMKSRQVGVNYACGDYYFFLDADDILPSDSLEQLYCAANSSHAEIVRGQIDAIKESGERISWGRDHLPYDNNSCGIIRALLEGKLRHNLASALFSRHIIKDFDYIVQIDMRNGEDGLMFYQLVLNITTPIIILPEVVYLYQIHSGSSTQKILSDQALRGLIFFYDYVAKIQFPEIKKLALEYSTRNINEFAVEQGYFRMKRIIKTYSDYPYLSLLYRIKYMTFAQNMRIIGKSFFKKRNIK